MTNTSAITISNSKISKTILNARKNLIERGKTYSLNEMFLRYKSVDELMDIIVQEASGSKYQSLIDFTSKNGHNN